jgi:hypothetical protein
MRRRRVIAIGGTGPISFCFDQLVAAHLAFCRPIIYQPASFADECRNQLPYKGCKYDIIYWLCLIHFGIGKDET